MEEATARQYVPMRNVDEEVDDERAGHTWRKSMRKQQRAMEEATARRTADNNDVASCCFEKSCVENHGLDKDVRSDNNRYSAKTFAEWSSKPDMAAFLETL